MGADSASPLTATAVNHPPNASAMWKLCTDQDLDLPERQKGVTRALCEPRKGVLGNPGQANLLTGRGFLLPSVS